MSARKSKGKSKQERLRSAAVVKLKYLQNAGRLDAGFQMVFRGVLNDLQLKEAEVDAFIESNREELTQLCLEG